MTNCSADFRSGPENGPMPAVRRARQAGFGLVDTMISIVVISVSTVGFLSAHVTSLSLEKENRTVAAANEMSRAVIEEMLAMPVQQVLPSYNSNKNDDPNGAGTARGAAWTMNTTAVLLADDQATSTSTGSTGLLSQVVGTTQQVLQQTTATATVTSARVAAAEALEVPKTMNCAIQLPTTKDAAGNEVLREDTVNPALGLPCDLNGDGKIDSLNHAADYKILPLSIRLSWPTPDGGTRTMTFATVIGGGKTP